MKKKDVQTLIDGLRAISEEIASLADKLETSEPAKVPVKNEEPEAAEEENPYEPTAAAVTKEASTEPVPEKEDMQKAPVYTFEQVRGILAEKSRGGHREQVKALITKHGGVQLSDYKDKPDILAELVKEAEGL